MQEITRYKSCDGLIFETADACIQHEEWFVRVNAVVSLLPKCNNLNHGEAFRHDKEAYELALTKAAELIVDYGIAGTSGYTTKEQVYDHLQNPMSLLHKILSETEAPFYQLCDFARYDSDGIEYEQIYFALHPQEAKFRN